VCAPASNMPGIHTMAQRLKTYLRPFRRRWGLTQQELAFLIGVKNGTVISRIEGLKKAPRLEWAVACAVLFDTRALELFPGLFSEVHEDLLRRATELYEELQGNPSKTTRVKLDFLETVLARLEKKRSTTDV
jgi:DNA-binding XRE family transcriptional regulator